jgi:phosphate starvation-inducible PhoH-like protein
MNGLRILASSGGGAALIKPRNYKQQLYLDLLHKQNPTVVIASGSSGSGKTIGAVSVGLEKLKAGDVDRLILTRPTVAVGSDNIGFLPGSLERKLEPWMKPIFDVMQLHYPKSKIEKMMKDGVFEIAPLAFMRGRTFSKSWVICDEAQNTTISQMLMMLTRIGKGSKLVITGDPLQHDRDFSVNGLEDLVTRLEYAGEELDPYVEVVYFEEGDVERHPMIPHILGLYK